MQAYQEGIQKLALENKNTTDISNEKIEDQSAPNWIVEKALKSCKYLIATEKIFKQMNLSLSEDEQKKAQETTDSMWESYGSMYEKNFGINKDSLHQASSLFNAKLEKIFNAKFGKDGTNAVSDDEIKDFYKNNYMKILFYTKTPYETTENSDETNSSQQTENNENSDEAKSSISSETIQKDFEQYTSSINNGSQSIDQIRDTLKKAENITDDTDPFVEQIINPNSSSLSSEISDAVKSLDPGKATYIKFNDIFFLLIKTTDSVEDPDLSDETKRNNILYDMKNDELESQIQETINNTNFSINYNAVNQFNPLMFSKLISA